MSEKNLGPKGADGRAPRVLLAVCGGIAAYKACEVLRGLQRAGCDVRVTMTEDALRFVGAATFEALSAYIAGDLSAAYGTAILAGTVVLAVVGVVVQARQKG